MIYFIHVGKCRFLLIGVFSELFFIQEHRLKFEITNSFTIFKMKHETVQRPI